MKRELSQFLYFGDTLRDLGGKMYRCTSHMPLDADYISVVPCEKWDDYRRACVGLGDWRDYVREISIKCVEPTRLIKLYDAETGEDFYVRAITELVSMDGFKGIVTQLSNSRDISFYFCEPDSDVVGNSRIIFTYDELTDKSIFHFKPIEQGKEVCV